MSALVALSREHQQTPTAVEPERARPATVASPQPATALPEAAPAKSPDLEGEVLEVLQVPSYTYLRLRTASGEVWTAVSTAEVKVHERARVADAAEMRSFESKTLKRSFDVIYFGRLAGADRMPPPGPVDPNAPLPPGHPPVIR